MSPNPNIKPRPENLTRAGKGQPKKGYKKVLVSLPPELVTKLDEIAKKQHWKRNYLIKELLGNLLGEPCDYEWSDIELILRGHAVE